MKIIIFILFFSLVSSVSCAGRLCFSYAETYYEQIYCELEAKGKGGDLPSFYDFRRNDEMVQALLLRQVSRRLGIELKIPLKASAPIAPASSSSLEHKSAIMACSLGKNGINCPSKRYTLVANQSNGQLGAEVLKDSNRMELAVFKGSLADRQAVDQYLQATYLQYLSKMMEIGLGGATLSYAKFAYLFMDLKAKGVDFSRRFETMYHYLKRDKININVPIKRQPPAEMTMDSCYPMQKLILCSVGLRNMIYL
jgi:hypothetical protein